MIVDLSKHHNPISSLFDIPASAEEWAHYRLTQDQLAFFHTNGYLSGLRMLDDAQIEELRAELTELIDPNYPGHDLFYEFSFKRIDRSGNGAVSRSRRLAHYSRLS